METKISQMICPECGATVRKLTGPDWINAIRDFRLLKSDRLRSTISLAQPCPGKGRLTQERLGQVFGLSQSYMSKLLKIEKDLSPELFKIWEAHPLSASIVCMWRIAKLPKDKQVGSWYQKGQL
jgi:hypothetical protein